jgi:hypothetical protein
MAFVNRPMASVDERLAHASDHGDGNVRCLHVNIL